MRIGIRPDGLRALGACAAALTLITACGSSGSGASDAATTGSDAAGTGSDAASATVCAKDAAAKKVDLPSGFPADFPFPPGTIVYSADDRGADGIVVTGVTSTPFGTVLRSLQTGLPAKGFTAEDGESEPHDAESDWSSDSYDGRWAIRELPQCPGDTAVDVVARATG